jgi:hypothetical protein
MDTVEVEDGRLAVGEEVGEFESLRDHADIVKEKPQITPINADFCIGYLRIRASTLVLE